MSSLKDSDEQTSPPATPGSRGVQVANSHFSKISASRGNSGWLKNRKITFLKQKERRVAVFYIRGNKRRSSVALALSSSSDP